MFAPERFGGYRAIMVPLRGFNGLQEEIGGSSGMFGVVDSGRLSACSNPEGFFSQAGVVGVGCGCFNYLFR